MTRAAWVVLAGAALTLAALLFDAAPLFVPGVAFALLGAGTPAWVWAAARGARVERLLAVDRVVEDEPVEAILKVRRGPLGLPGGEVLDPLTGAPISVSGPPALIAGSAEVQIRVVASFSRRGIRRMGPPSLVVRDAFDLASSASAGQGAVTQLLVLPRTEPVRWTGGARPRRSEGAAGRYQSEPFAAVDVDGLRPYRPGTPASRIQWSALARGAGLLERRLQADGDSRPLIVLDARSQGPPEHLDAAVRAAASLTLELARQGGCRLLLPGERRATTVEADLVAWPTVHARLALVEGGPGARAPMLGAGGRHGPVFYVAAQPLERVPAGLTTNLGGGGVLVLPAALDGRLELVARFEVTGCLGYPFGAGRVREGGRAA
jgi:uncharacterized protein (DUF58 family)